MVRRSPSRRDPGPTRRGAERGDDPRRQPASVRRGRRRLSVKPQPRSESAPFGPFGGFLGGELPAPRSRFARACVWPHRQLWQRRSHYGMARKHHRLSAHDVGVLGHAHIEAHGRSRGGMTERGRPWPPPSHVPTAARAQGAWDLGVKRCVQAIGPGGGSRTLMPLRAADFESAAYAIPPLRAEGCQCRRMRGSDEGVDQARLQLPAGQEGRAWHRPRLSHVGNSSRSGGVSPRLRC